MGPLFVQYVDGLISSRPALIQESEHRIGHTLLKTLVLVLEDDEPDIYRVFRWLGLFPTHLE